MNLDIEAWTGKIEICILQIISIFPFFKLQILISFHFQIFTAHCQSSGDEVDIATFSSMQSLAYDLVKEHFHSPIPKSAPHQIITSIAGTGKTIS